MRVVGVAIIEKVDEMLPTLAIDWWLFVSIDDNQHVPLLALIRIRKTCNAIRNSTMKWLLLLLFLLYFHCLLLTLLVLLPR
jgi:hypothetical protein